MKRTCLKVGAKLKIAVVTDSTSDLPADLATKHDISVVPLNVHFGTEAYKDGIDMNADEFYKRLQNEKTLPTTSAPSAGQFAEVYLDLAKNHDSIISLHVSSKISATYSAAVQASEEVRSSNIDVKVIDTLQASMALGLVTMAVSKQAKEGSSIDSLVDLAKRLSLRAQFSGLVETLEYLQKGGRIGKASALLGSILKIKPLLAMVDGEAHPIDRPRTRIKGINRMKQLVAEAGNLDSLCVLHSTDPDLAKEIAYDLRGFTPTEKPIVTRLGPVVGTYLGPGMLGVAWLKAE